jgi:serine/threonine protein kinase/Tol biopolymer transport system component
MDADRWRRVEALYHDALRFPPDQRVRFLTDACGSDETLRREVESLLSYQTSAEAFIEGPAVEVAARLMASDWSGASLSGTTIGQFRVLEQLGEGGMGVVYEALDTRLGRTVALKFLPPSSVSTPQTRERFEREARAASALNHPNICTIYSVQEHEGQPFIEMERLEGRTLRERISSEPLAVADVVSLALQLIDGLEAAHAKGIVHRDLKPGNVFCTERGVAKILDFGIAKLGAATDADPDALLGTASYMSPEQALGRPVDSRTDLFSLGAVIYEMATGRAPFPGPSTASIRRAILDAEPTPPRQLNREVPPALERVILTALRKDRESRYQSAAELRTAIERLQQHSARRRRVVVTTAVLVLLIAGSAAVWSALRRRGDVFDMNLRQITHNASEYSVSSGTISPDGTQVVYADPRGINIQAVATLEAARVPQSERLSDNAYWDLSPGWLPDGTQFVANMMSADGAPGSSVWLVGLSGGLKKLRDRAEATAVSADGSTIAFATLGSRQGYRDLWLMKSDGTMARKLFDAANGGSIASPSWAPDGRRLAYQRANETGAFTSIETRDTSGGPPATVFRAVEAETLQGLAWLRDGRVLYSLRRLSAGTSAGAIPCTHWQLPLDGTGRPIGASTRMAGWLPHCVGPLSLAADGKRASFIQSAFQDAIHVIDLDASGTRTSASRRLTFTEGRNIPSGWTSDNRAIVFVSDWRGRAALVRQAIDADTIQPIAEEPGIVGAARLTPDGADVLYLALPGWFDVKGTQRLMRVPVTGGASQQVVTGAFVDGGARCTALPAKRCAIAERRADGRQLVFTSIEIDKGRGVELARIDAIPNADYRWALSPDGSRIAVLNTFDGGIRVVSLAGLPSRDVDIKDRKKLGYLSWTSDGKRLLVPSVDASVATLLSVDLDGHAQILWQQPGAIDISGIPSPDGRRVAVWVRGRHSNLWLAEIP